MKHVSDKGALPPHVEEQRTRVSVHSDAPRHTGTVEYAGAYLGSGVDNSFSMERFKRDFKIEVQSLDEEEMVFDMIGIDPAIANAFRRILLSEVPTMAIEKVFILNNTSMIQDEMLSHRLGLIPIKADPRKFKDKNAEDESDEHNIITFRLQVKCEAARGAFLRDEWPALLTHPSDEDLERAAASAADSEDRTLVDWHEAFAEWNLLHARPVRWDRAVLADGRVKWVLLPW